VKILKGSGNLTGILLAVIGFAFFAFSDVVYKYVSSSCPVLVMVFYGVTVTLACAAVSATRHGGIVRHLATERRGLHIVRGAVMLVNSFLFIYGISGLPVAQTYTIDNMSPMVATLLAFIFLGEKPERHRIACILGGFLGVLIVLRPGIIPMSIHALAVLGSTMTFAVTNILTRKIGKQDSPLTFSFYGQGVCFVVLGLYNIYLGWIVPAPKDLALLVLSGVLVFVAGIAITRAFSIADVALVSKFQYTQLLWGALLGYLVFGDVPDGWVVLGASVIIGSGICLAYYENKMKKNAC
jgi:drug/metabolite transporter (DMT)-like permease